MKNLLPFLSALLIWASFPPLDLGFLAWVAWAPMIVHAATAPKGWKAFLISWGGGVLFFTVGVEWVRYNVPFGPPLMGLYLGLYFGLFVLGIRRASAAGWSLLWSVPAIWIALEFIRSHMLTGFPWLLAGHTQYRMSMLIQTADLWGVWGPGAIVLFVNALVARAWTAGREGGWKDLTIRVGTVTAVILLAGSMIYGVIRTKAIEVREGPEVVAVQPNIPQSIKLMMAMDYEEAMRKAREIFDKHVRLTLAAMEEGKPDLVIWPESVVYGGLWETAGGELREHAGWYPEFRSTADRAGVPILLGSEVLFWEPDRSLRKTNSALLFEPGRGATMRYDKMHLVPFAEKLLLADTFPFIKDIARSVVGGEFNDFTPGGEMTLFETGNCRFGTLVCFEVVFPEILRKIAGKGGEFAVNISNEGWFRSSAELDQMHAMATFRAVETRTALVRATNTGISAVFSPTGEATAVLEVSGRRKEVEGVLRARVPVSDAGTIYGKWGDWLAWVLSIGAVVALGRIPAREKAQKA